MAHGARARRSAPRCGSRWPSGSPSSSSCSTSGWGCWPSVLSFFRRRWPLPIAVVTAALHVGVGLASGPATLASVSVATRRRWAEIAGRRGGGDRRGPRVPVRAARGGRAAVADLRASTSSRPAAMLAWGMYIGSRRELLWTLRHRAERAEAEQELRAAQARSNERARIAREMHDVLAHRISQISMHAGALAFREDLTADEMRDERRRDPGQGQRGAHRPARRARRAPGRGRRAHRTRRCRRTPTCRRWSRRPASPGWRRPRRPADRRRRRCPTRPGGRSTGSSRRA